MTDDLVQAEWLVEHLDDPGVVVVDIRGYVETVDHGGGRQSATYRGAPEEYAAGHIPGSVFVDWTRDIVDPDAPVKAQIARPERFTLAMEALGVSDGSFVVVADHTGGHFATRLWWALRFYGHDSVAILDGGYARWRSLELPLSTETPGISPGSFTSTPVASLRHDYQDVLASIESGDRIIVDARDEGQYSGAVQRGIRGGHIPTARHLPARSMIGTDGRWLSAGKIRALAHNAGIDGELPVTAYCNGGVTATAVLFGLHLAAQTEGANYDGSWNEWGERQELPVTGNRDLWRESGPDEG